MIVHPAAATTDCTRAVHPFVSAPASIIRGQSGNSLRFCTMPYREDFVTVHRRDDNGVIHDFSLYYRVYYQSLMLSLESPPLIILSGGP